MTDATGITGNKPLGAVFERGAFIRAIMVALIIASGVAGLYLLEKSLHLTFNKEPLEPNQPLPLLSKHIGGYVAEGFDESMNEEIIEVLGTKDYLLRTYTDPGKLRGDPGATIKLNINYYATGSSAPHVPEICWAGGGMVESPDSRQVFEVPDVRRKDGSVITLRMRMISFLPRGEAEPTARTKNVAYFFAVNGEYVATPKEVVSRFWKATNRYAYNAKIEMTIGGQDEYCSLEEAKSAASEFIRAALPQLEEILPDPAKLNETTNSGEGTGIRSTSK